MKIKIKKKGKEKFFIIDSDYISTAGDGSVTILFRHDQDIAHQVFRDLYCFLECYLDRKTNPVWRERDYWIIMSQSEYIYIRKSDVYIFKKDDKFCLEVYVDNELILS